MDRICPIMTRYIDGYDWNQSVITCVKEKCQLWVDYKEHQGQIMKTDGHCGLVKG